MLVTAGGDQGVISLGKQTNFNQMNSKDISSEVSRVNNLKIKQFKYLKYGWETFTASIIYSKFIDKIDVWWTSSGIVVLS